MRCEQKYGRNIQLEETAVFHVVALSRKEHDDLYQDNAKDTKLHCARVLVRVRCWVRQQKIVQSRKLRTQSPNQQRANERWIVPGRKHDRRIRYKQGSRASGERWGLDHVRDVDGDRRGSSWRASCKVNWTETSRSCFALLSRKPDIGLPWNSPTWSLNTS